MKNINLKKINYSADRKSNNNQKYSNLFKRSKLYKISTQNDTENISKFRQELISAGNTSNSKIIIPIMRRSNSLLIFNGIQTGKNIRKKSNFKISNKSRNYKRQELKKKYNTFMDIKIGITNRKKILDKLHKIKIEKGMMNYNVLNLKKYSNKEYNSSFKQNIFLPKLFDTTGRNIIRNNSSRSCNKICGNIN